MYAAPGPDARPWSRRWSRERCNCGKGAVALAVDEARWGGAVLGVAQELRVAEGLSDSFLLGSGQPDAQPAVWPDSPVAGRVAGDGRPVELPPAGAQEHAGGQLQFPGT